MSRSCFFHLRNISKLRHMVSPAELEKIVHAFVSSRLDYCNALFTSLDKLSLSRLQAIQNAAARLLTCSSKGLNKTVFIQSTVGWKLVKCSPTYRDSRVWITVSKHSILFYFLLQYLDYKTFLIVIFWNWVLTTQVLKNNRTRTVVYVY